jgi:hypothetical protein
LVLLHLQALLGPCSRRSGLGFAGRLPFAHA